MSISFRKTDTVIISVKEVLSKKQRKTAQKACQERHNAWRTYALSWLSPVASLLLRITDTEMAKINFIRFSSEYKRCLPERG